MRQKTLILVSILFASLICSRHPPAAAAGKPGPDIVPPIIQILSPTDQQRVNSPALEVVGSATDNVGVASLTLSLNGGAPLILSVDMKGNFRSTLHLPAGGSTLIVRAADKAGNVASVPRTVIFEAAPLEILSPLDGASVDAGWIDIQGRRDETIIRVVSNDTLAELTPGKFTIARIPLALGLNTIIAVGVDAAGNRVETSIEITCTSPQEPFGFAASPRGGSPPLPVTFTWVQHVSGFVSSCEIDYEGTGNFAPAPGGIAGLSHTYTGERTYYPTVRVMMGDGGRFTQRLTLPVYPPARALGSFPAADPAALAMSRNGFLYVLERGADRVRIFAPSGAETMPFGSTGSGPRQFNRPSGLALDGEGNIYVADTGNNRVQKFSPGSSHLMTIGRRGTRLGEFDRPQGIVVDPDGYIYVTEGGNHRVQQFDRLGNSLRAWGANVLTNPWGIGAFQRNTFVVADEGKGHVLLFSNSGDSLAWKEEPPALVGPSGITTDQGRQTLAVADRAGNKVLVLDTAGTPIREIASIAGDSLGLSAPFAAVRNTHPTEEQYFIADSGHGRVLKIGFSGAGASGPIEAAWAGMKGALDAGDSEGALLYFAKEAHERYRQIFSLVVAQTGGIPAIPSGPLLPLKIEQDEAEYGLVVMEGGEQFMYRVQFILDESGSWKILSW